MATFGNAEFGVYTFPPTTGTLVTTAVATLSVSYLITPIAGQGLAVTYGVQAFRAAVVPIFYQITSPITDFSINSVLFPRPHRMVWTFPGEIGMDLSGVPIKQGFMSLEWQYDVMSDTQMAQLQNTYDPSSPLVVITYPNELGYWVQKQAMMQPPEFGSRQTVIHQSVVVKFSHISSD